MQVVQTADFGQQTNAIAETLKAAFEHQRKAYLAQPYPSLDQRKQDLKALKNLLMENREAIIEAINKDYGNRCRQESLFAEVISTAGGIDDLLKHTKKWMKPQKRHVDQTMFPGGKSRVVPQPLGVVGLIIPWNFPINLCFSQLATAFATGNRAMVKMSENSINLTRLLIELSPRYFSEDKLAFFEETGGVGIEFSQIPFDLIVFTGSGQTGKAVMASAAKNLTPVILELGGKAPAVIAPDFSIEKAVDRIMFIKQFNAGQICTNVDYVFVPEDKKEAFVAAAKAWTAKHCPDINSPDYTSVIDDRSFKRLQDTIDDATSKGATVINLNGQEGNQAARKMPLHLILDTTADMTIRNRETFGPLLMVLTYNNENEVVDYINSHDRPLALYPFSNKKALQDMYIERVMSGGVTVNDALYHVGQHDIPFGGVGPSGMGHYHGKEGFMSFSKLRPIYYQPRWSPMEMLRPPYTNFAKKTYEFLVKMNG
ncbi:coniferyl aldehyde dehydrogenase [Spongiibacter sp. KMU-158]|uniref:Aldehyde dehydrogenase n=1 Tax=Spongiibacter pelagi TaxID=2760804 RepID=A0A927C183_9GAMM|nr:coniferyl aldehyde dehydrogenase [Spongiibacter pelagi]MBD2859395.1 coniferyl aldehyde dehydrogenase [Spongiibacter pelagi]